jgi:hypothetical protein
VRLLRLNNVPKWITTWALGFSWRAFPVRDADSWLTRTFLPHILIVLDTRGGARYGDRGALSQPRRAVGVEGDSLPRQLVTLDPLSDWSGRELRFRLHPYCTPVPQKYNRWYYAS